MEHQCRMVDEKQAAAMLLAHDRILVLCHQKPDGDTLGSGFAMAHVLKGMGKLVHVVCSDPFTKKFDMLYGDILSGGQPDFEPEFVLAMDIADTQLLGKSTACYGQHIDLCIDHHPSNTKYARYLYLDPKAAATVELAARVIDAMDAPWGKQVANCLYTGLATDTGCFRYSNVTTNTHLLAARLISCGADHAVINKRMFETKSAARMELEQLVMSTLEYGYEKQYATVVITREAIRQTGAVEDDIEGLSTMPRQIEGVEVCATFKEKEEGGWRVSMRGGPKVNVSVLCAAFGGGGHARAAGCSIDAPIDEAKALLAVAVGKALRKGAEAL